MKIKYALGKVSTDPLSLKLHAEIDKLQELSDIATNGTTWKLQESLLNKRVLLSMAYPVQRM